jgi:hypothetical protein
MYQNGLNYQNGPRDTSGSFASRRVLAEGGTYPRRNDLRPADLLGKVD